MLLPQRLAIYRYANAVVYAEPPTSYKTHVIPVMQDLLRNFVFLKEYFSFVILTIISLTNLQACSNIFFQVPTTTKTLTPSVAYISKSLDCLIFVQMFRKTTKCKNNNFLYRVQNPKCTRCLVIKLKIK